MSTNAKAKPVVHAGTSILMKPRFSPGLLLRDDDLNQGVDYTRDLSRLLFRTLLGCGVVCGLRVTSEFKCQQLVVSVAEGVALDCHGDPIHVPTTQLIPIDGSCGQTILDEMWVIIKRTEKCCAPRAASCSCDDEETPAVCTRERDGLRDTHRSATAGLRMRMHGQENHGAHLGVAGGCGAGSRRRKEQDCEEGRSRSQDGGCPRVLLRGQFAGLLQGLQAGHLRLRLCGLLLRVDRARLSEARD